MKILFLPRFGQQGASSRLRLLQYIPVFKLAAIESVVSPLFDDAMLLQKYQHGGYGFLTLLSAYWRRVCVLLGANQFDLIWIEKEALPWFPAWLEKWLLRGKPYVLDFDDAIFHNYDLHRFAWVRCIYGRRIDRLMSGARLVTAGNQYLADRAHSAGAQWVEVIPTVVDLDRYKPKLSAFADGAQSRIVWIGSPSTVQYLLELSASLAALAERHPFTLRVIGGGKITMPGVDVEVVTWSEETEAEVIAACDIGIMPLRNTPWEQGKCAYKLIQYMACGLPTVASPIGANIDVVVDGETGLFASGHEEWIQSLTTLLEDENLRHRMGHAGRVRVAQFYSLQQVAPKLTVLFNNAVLVDA